MIYDSNGRIKKKKNKNTTVHRKYCKSFSIGTYTLFNSQTCTIIYEIILLTQEQLTKNISIKREK